VNGRMTTGVERKKRNKIERNQADKWRCLLFTERYVGVMSYAATLRVVIVSREEPVLPYPGAGMRFKSTNQKEHRSSIFYECGVSGCCPTEAVQISRVVFRFLTNFCECSTCIPTLFVCLLSYFVQLCGEFVRNCHCCHWKCASGRWQIKRHLEVVNPHRRKAWNLLEIPKLQERKLPRWLESRM